MVPHRGGHRDVDAGQGTVLLGKVLLVAYLMEHSIRVVPYVNMVISRGDRLVPDCPLNHVSLYMYDLLRCFRYYSSTSRVISIRVRS